MTDDIFDGFYALAGVDEENFFLQILSKNLNKNSFRFVFITDGGFNGFLTI
jgi:hypothetical protein